MKKLILFLSGLFFIVHTFGHEVSGVVTNAETGEPLPDFEILLTYTNGGIAAAATTAGDGSFTFTDITNGTYELEFYTYPDPVMLNGDYFLLTEHTDMIVVDGSNVTGIEFDIPPHHPDHVLTGTLYDAVTNDTITIQDFEVRAKLQYYVEFFYDYSAENGTYLIEDLPDWTYEFNIFENDYYEGVTTEITIDPASPDTVVMDFYLEPKMGATVTGVLLDSTTNEPIMRAGRSIKLQAINSLFTQTNAEGEFTFINVPPGTYSAIEVTSQDTAYVNTSGSEIGGFVVPEEGVNGVELYQKPWISIHEVTADEYFFEPGTTKTVTFSITNDDLTYGSIWGVNLKFPDGVTVLETTAFLSDGNTEVIFDQKPDCSSDYIKAWEGWHWTGVPHFSSTEGNLEVLNESAHAEVTLEFADSASMETAPVFFEIYYSTHCFDIEPFSYGTIMMQNDDITGQSEPNVSDNTLNTYPNPAANATNVRVELDKPRKGEIVVFDVSGQEVMHTGQEIFDEGSNSVRLNTSRLGSGIYYYNFLADDLKLTGKLVISR